MPPIASTTTVVVKPTLLQNVRAVVTHLSSLPAPPFLVPALIEALKHSQYRSITEVVPGEADGFCAARAQAHGGVVISSDSDLLVTDLGSHGSVSLFKDLSLYAEHGRLIIKTSIFKPKDIAAHLGLPDLLGLAFQLTNDGTMSLHEAIRRAKLLTQTIHVNISYQDFIKCYKIANGPEEGSNPYSEHGPESQSIDPRVSELLLHYRMFASKAEAGVKAYDFTFQPRFYLPFLLDDPARASAWVISTSLRTMTYSLLNLTVTVTARPTTIAEYGRSGHRIVPKELRMLTRAECKAQCISLAERMKKVRSLTPLSSSNFWPLYGVYELCRWYKGNNKPLPSKDALEKVVHAGRQGKSISNWDDLHLLVQLQGVLYSLRILRQIMTHLTATHRELIHDDCRELLYDQLCELPSIKQLFLSRYHVGGEQGQDSHWDDIMRAVVDMIEDESTDREHAICDNHRTGTAEQAEVEHAFSEAVTGHEEVQPRKKRRKRVIDGISAKRKTPNHMNNMYTVLYRS